MTQIFPVGIDDHRKIISVLDKNKQPYFTYRLPEKKSLKVVWRGIPDEI